MKGDTTGIPNQGRAKQVLSSLVVTLMTLHAGLSQGWQSPMSLKLKQDDSPVETLSINDLGTLATIPSYFGLCTSLFISFLAHKFGRKVAMYTTGVTSAIGGAVVTFAPNKIYLFVGRSLASAASGAVQVAPMFISEIVHESMRGTLMAMCTLQLNIGILSSYAAGAKLSYKAYNLILVIFPLICTILLVFLPETPLFLAEKSRMEDAKKSMIWYRGGCQHIAEQELERISSKNVNEEKVPFYEMLKSKTTRLAMIISVSGFVFQSLSGIYAILNYSGIIFEKSGSLMSPEDSSIVIASILLGSSLVNASLMDMFGRKPLLYFSFVGTAIGMVVLAIFCFVRAKGSEFENLEWIPISSVSLFVFSYGVGLAAVPGAILNEVSPTNIRPTVGAMAMVAACVIMMILLQAFPYLDSTFGLYSVFVIPAVANAAGILFSIFMVPETKGKSLLEIQEELENR